MSIYYRVLLVHSAMVIILVFLAAILNVLAWMTTPDPFPDTIWNLVMIPFLRVVAAIGGVGYVLSAVTEPVTLRLLRKHKRRVAPQK